MAYLIFKRYNPQTVLLFAGLIMLGLAIVLPDTGVVRPEKWPNTGNALLDVFDHVRFLFSTTGAELGLIIMAVGGFSLTMEKIGASEALVRLAVKPLSKINKPYLVLSCTYILAQCLCLIIPSAAGLAMLLMVTVYPLLRGMGISRLSAAAVIATGSCLDLGPASSNANIAAKVSGMSVQEYFIQYQAPVALVVMAVVMLSHYFTQRYFDRKEGTMPDKADWADIEAERRGANPAQAAPSTAAATAGTVAKTAEVVGEGVPPTWYALIPFTPLVLLIVFSPFVITTVKMPVATAMLISAMIGVIAEMLRHRSFRQAGEVFKVFFEGMGRQFTNIVTLIVAAQMFAAGLTQLGFIETIINASKGANFGAIPITIVLTLIILLAAVVTGSGNAPWFAFSPLAPEVAQSVGVQPVFMAQPMELASGLGRSMSPVAGVVIAVAGLAGVNPMDIVKRTAPVMVAAYITMIISSMVWDYIASTILI
ncbi:C4-dicarboxylate transporter DcuC [Trueperella pecoris]|uniref:C4-dicarboxylate transporter DcuC n=1 Tax=Trueperella pecoris TaxID=2733571 RepID=A0A7M1R4E9_9ACTO|nr:C4-dicarboxylate transporter DcuC [Trueperella pecoris]QOR48345.1 C4-dicarboxylate transporter DcuC [Trueperella pecoris]